MITHLINVNGVCLNNIHIAFYAYSPRRGDSTSNYNETSSIYSSFVIFSLFSLRFATF